MKHMFHIIAAGIIVIGLFFISAPTASAAECIPYTTGPELFAANRISSSSATLYFTPLNDSIQKYVIDYGLSIGDRRYSVQFDSGYSPGAVSYTVHGLDPAFTYYYSVSAMNTCSQTSPWSNWRADNATSVAATDGNASDSASGPKDIAAPGSGALLMGLLFSGGMIAGGVRFYRQKSN